jgi:hypothetical protein
MKCEDFEHSFIRRFCPKCLDQFVILPSMDASGGIIVLCNCRIFNGTLLEVHHLAIKIQFSFTKIQTSGPWLMFMAHV